MTVKNEHYIGEVNESPVPRLFAQDAAKMGIRILLYYENVTSFVKPIFAAKRIFPYYSLSHLIEGDGFWIEEGAKEKAFGHGSGVLVTPGKAHNYGGYKKTYLEDSICFAGEVPNAMYRAGLLKNGIVFIGKERKLLPIIQALRHPSLKSQLEAHALLLKLLLELKFETIEPKKSSLSLIDNLQIMLRKNPNCFERVNDMAEYCNLSTKHFRALFKQHTGLTPKAFLEQIKLNQAIELLSANQLPVLEIAERLNFSDSYYFYRFFKNMTRVTPGEYRKIYGLKD